MTPARAAISETTDGRPARPGFEAEGAPAPINPATGQHEAYWILSKAEREKGFVRPVRQSYLHVGQRPKYPLRDLTPEERERHAQFNYVKYEAYPESESPCVGRYWTEAQLRSGCGGETRMGLAIAETYARNPAYYGSTFCVGCGKHFPVGAHGEFVWVDGGRETAERVGT